MSRTSRSWARSPSILLDRVDALCAHSLRWRAIRDVKLPLHVVHTPGPVRRTLREPDVAGIRTGIPRRAGGEGQRSHGASAARI